MSEEIIYGTLDAFSETGSEGVLWAIQQDDKPGYEGLFILEDGDYLEVFDFDGKIRWEGSIELDWETCFQSQIVPIGGEQIEVGQQMALGYWINGVQKNCVPDVWAQMFFDRPPARLTRDERELQVEEIEEIADE